MFRSLEACEAPGGWARLRQPVQGLQACHPLRARGITEDAKPRGCDHWKRHSALYKHTSVEPPFAHSHFWDEHSKSAAFILTLGGNLPYSISPNCSLYEADFKTLNYSSQVLWSFLGGIS